MCISIACNGGSSDQELDGPALKFGLGTLPRSEWLREIVPLLGQRLKAHNVLCSFGIKEQTKVCTNPVQSLATQPRSINAGQTGSTVVGITNKTLLLFPSDVYVQVSVVSTVASNWDAAYDCNVASNYVASGSRNATTPLGKVRL